MSGRYNLGDTGSRLRCPVTTSGMVLPSNTGRPHRLWYKTTPSAYRSARESTTRLRHCSGLMYKTVPIMVPSRLMPSCSGCFTKPKSNKTGALVLVRIKMFCGLMSRCTMPSLCTASRALESKTKTFKTSANSLGVCNHWLRSQPSTYSITNQGCDSSSKKSITRTIPGCSRRCIARNSR